MEHQQIISLDLINLAYSFGLVLLAIGLARLRRIGEEGQMLWASIRMVLQLIVSLPGMMTGQILSGTEPIIAVRYQIAIMCAITGAVAIISFLILVQGYRRYFSAAHQLKERN
jgi:ABC-type iron transport system FetAB permease component